MHSTRGPGGWPFQRWPRPGGYPVRDACVRQKTITENIQCMWIFSCTGCAGAAHSPPIFNRALFALKRERNDNATSNIYHDRSAPPARPAGRKCGVCRCRRWVAGVIVEQIMDEPLRPALAHCDGSFFCCRPMRSDCSNPGMIRSSWRCRSDDPHPIRRPLVRSGHESDRSGFNHERCGSPHVAPLSSLIVPAALCRTCSVSGRVMLRTKIAEQEFRDPVIT